MEAINLRNQQQSPLIRLPPEIRNMIYEYAIGGYLFKICFWGDSIEVKRYYSNEVYYQPDARFGMNSLRLTCRLIRHETDKMHFAINTFEFFEMEHAAFDHHHATMQKLDHIKIASIRVRRSDNLDICISLVQKLQFLQRLKGLKRVEVIPAGAYILDGFAPRISRTPGSSGLTSETLKKIEGVFGAGWVGQPVEFVEMAPPKPLKPSHYFGKP